MRVDHFDQQALERFLDGELPSEEACRIERHLAICSDCRDLADQVSLLAKLEVLDSWLYPDYNEAFERAAVGAAERLEGLLSEARSTEDLFAELLRETAQVRRFKIRNQKRYHSPKLCQLLQERSRQNWFLDPTAALELADLALLVAQYLDAGRYGSSLVEDSRALSLAYLGNAFRITSNLWRADQALRQAWIHHIQAGGDLYTATELINFTCSLRRTQGRFDEAKQLIDRAMALHHEAQDRHLEGAALIRKALIFAYEYRFQEAIPLVWVGLSRIDAEQDPQLVLRGRANLIECLCRSGEAEQARNLLRESRHLFYGQGDRTDAMLQALEGFIAKGLGRLTEAESMLLGVRDFLLQGNYAVDFFSLSLDLADMFTQIGRYQSAREILREVIPLGESLGLRRNVLLARLFYEQVSRA